jgi:raffinose/stachyose/melibiose transport system permease protein
MGPSLLMYTALFILPLVNEIYYSFTNWDGVSATYSFVQMSNYIRVFRDSAFWDSMSFTVRLSFFIVVIANCLAFFWAYILSHDIPMKNLWKALIFLPRVIGGVILGYLWRFIFQGAFVQFGKWTGWEWFAQGWFTTPESSFWALVIVMSWALSGYLMLIYSAGFSAIPTEYYEASQLDGATKIQQLKHITLPMLRGTITRCLFLTITWAMLMYDTNISLTNGNPFRSSEGVTMNIYDTAFRSRQIGYGSAKSVVFLVILVVISFLQIRLTSRKEEDAS